MMPFPREEGQDEGGQSLACGAIIWLPIWFIPSILSTISLNLSPSFPPFRASASPREIPPAPLVPFLKSSKPRQSCQ